MVLLDEDQSHLVRTWYHDLPSNEDEARVMFRFALLFHDFCTDKSDNADHDKYLANLRNHGEPDTFFNKAAVLHPTIFRITFELLKHHGFDRPPNPPSNYRYSRKVAWIIYPGDEFQTQRELAATLITQHHSRSSTSNPTSTAGNPAAGPSSSGMTSQGPLSYNSSFIPPPVTTPRTVPAQVSSVPFTSSVPMSSMPLLQQNALHQYHTAIRNLMNAYPQLQLVQPTTNEAQLVHPMILPGIPTQFGTPLPPQTHSIPQATPRNTSGFPASQYPMHHLNPTPAPQFSPEFSRPNRHHYDPDSGHASVDYNNQVNRGNSGFRNAMNMAKRFQNKESKYSGADNENIMDYIVQ